jgi:hypothetical protein
MNATIQGKLNARAAKPVVTLADMVALVNAEITANLISRAIYSIAR